MNVEEQGTGDGVSEEFMCRMLKLPMRDKLLSRIRCGMCSGVCPLDVPRFEDAPKTSGIEGLHQVREISHMVAEAMGLVGGSNP